MGKWRYRGLSQDGEKHAGEIEANSEREARKILRLKGIRAKQLSAPSVLEFDIGEWMVQKGFSAPFGTKELTHFTKQMAIMVDAGIPIIQILEILFKSQRHPVLKRSIKTITREIGEGKTISESMEAQKGFSRLYCNLIRAGEVGGILNTILNKIAEHMDKQEKMKSQIKGAMTYPMVIVIVGTLVVWLLMVFVVPQFVGMVKSSGQEVPWITQFVIDTSNFLRDYLIVSIFGAAIAAFILISYLKTDSGKEIYDRTVMKVPILGSIVIKGNLASFTRTLATMLSSGVSLVESLDVCIETLDNKIIASDLLKVRNKVIKGGTLTESLQRVSYFPELVAQMVRVGEQTGQIDGMLIKVSDVFEDEVSELITDMTKMIEPLVIVVLGSIIAGVMVAMYLPLFLSAGGTD